MIDCKVIRDLLPLYADEVVSGESKAFIEAHLAECEGCQKELANAQSTVSKLPQRDGEKINALKSVKKKFFRQKVIVSAVACVVAIAVAFGGSFAVFHADRPIRFEEGLVRVERGTAESQLEDGTPTTVTVLDVVMGRNFYAHRGASRQITRDGEQVEVMFMHMTDTLATRIWRQSDNDRLFRLAGVGENESFSIEGFNYPSLPLEIYYLVMDFTETFSMSDEEFYNLRHDAVLLWSGVMQE